MSQRKTYFFYIDDVIFLFRDLYQKPPKSLFENAFLGMLRDIHERYGLRVQLNCFGRTLYSHGSEVPFTIDKTPDTWKAEWEANSDWLKLAFHAGKEFPAYPYINATYDEMLADYTFVRDNIIRFAGEKTFTTTTNIHFLPASRAACQALVDNGVKIIGTSVGEVLPADYDLSNLSASARERLLLNRTEETSWVYGKVYDISSTAKPDIKGYNHMTDAEHEITRGECRLFYNAEMGVHYVDFNTDGMILNSSTQAEIAAMIKDATSRFIHVGIGDHEQYFHSGYTAYQADYADKIELMARMMKEAGFEPIYYEEYLPKV